MHLNLNSRFPHLKEYFFDLNHFPIVLVHLVYENSFLFLFIKLKFSLNMHHSLAKIYLDLIFNWKSFIQTI